MERHLAAGALIALFLLALLVPMFMYWGAS